MNTLPLTINKQPVKGKGLRRTGIAVIALGVMSILACELPVILALIGFGGLSAAALAFETPFVVDVVGILLTVMGVGLLIVLAVWRLRSRRSRVHQ